MKLIGWRIVRHSCTQHFQYVLFNYFNFLPCIIVLIFVHLIIILDDAILFTQEFSTKNKLLITGTPLQNSVEELWYYCPFLVLVWLLEVLLTLGADFDLPVFRYMLKEKVLSKLKFFSDINIMLHSFFFLAKCCMAKYLCLLFIIFYNHSKFLEDRILLPKFSLITSGTFIRPDVFRHVTVFSDLETRSDY